MGARIAKEAVIVGAPVYAAPPTQNGRNMYEAERDAHTAMSDAVHSSDATRVMTADIASVFLEYVAPYICRYSPYARDARYWAHYGRWLLGAAADPRTLVARLWAAPSGATAIIARILSFVRPRMMLTEPVPCTITTIGKVDNFDYEQDVLLAALKARGAAGLADPRIRWARNPAGLYLAAAEPDPASVRAAGRNGRPAKPASSLLFGKSQTTFSVRTAHRDAGKRFAVKVFQRHVSFETLGGLWVDCRDTRDVNETVLGEIRACLGRPDLVISDFTASMRNYRFELLGGYNIRLAEVARILQELWRNGRRELFCTFDPIRYPAAIISIDVPNHTSRKKQLMIKLFQSGKINLDSCVHYEHVYTWYRFLNDFFATHAADVLYVPPRDGDEYDSDYYYRAAGVEPPPDEVVDA